MPASVVRITKTSQLRAGKPVYKAGERIETFESVNAWLAEKQRLNITVRGLEGKVFVEDLEKWQAYEELTSDGAIVTVLEEHAEGSERPENGKSVKANLTCFRVSYETLTPILELHHIHYSRRIRLSEGPMAAGFLVEVSLVGGWGVLAVALLAWMKAKLGRSIKITKPDGTTVELKGYSADVAASFLKSAKEITVIDTNKSSS